MNLSVPNKGTVGSRITSNAKLLFGAKAIGAVLGLIALLVTQRSLNDFVAFGTVIFLHGYMIFFAEMMTFQPWQSLIRFGSDDSEAKDGASFAKLVKFAAILDAVAVVLSYLAAIALFGVFVAFLKAYPDFWVGNEQIDPSKLFGLVVAYSSVVLFQQTGMSTGVLRLFDKFNGLALAWLVMPSVRLVGVLIAAHQGWGMIGFIAVWYVAALVRNFVVIGLGLSELAKRGILKPVISAKVNFLKPRDGLWSFTTKAFLDSSLSASFSHLPLLLVTAVFGPIFVPVYKYAEETAKLLSEGVKLLDQVIYPELARIVSAGKGGQMLRLVTKASAVALAVGAVLSVLAYFLAPPLVERFLGEGYEMVPSLTVLLVLGAAIFATVAPLYPVFYAVGKPERAIYARAAGVVAYITSFIVLTRWLGEIGTGWAWIAGYSVALVVVLILVIKTLSQFKESPE